MQLDVSPSRGIARSERNTGHSYEAQPANVEKPLRPAVPKNGDTAIAVFDAPDIAQEEKPYRNTGASFDADERRETG
jgi:hypothetical protein